MTTDERGPVWTVVLKYRANDNIYVMPHGQHVRELQEAFGRSFGYMHDCHRISMRGSLGDVVRRLDDVAGVHEQRSHADKYVMTVKDPARVSSIFFADGHDDHETGDNYWE